ncbi:MAG: BMC domain-containing protein [Eubacterium sp.]|nr:BMC domain-containing protein [Eubacterium sp.]
MAEKKAINRAAIVEKYSGLAVATIEFDLMVPSLAALDAAAKTADIQIEAVERNRLVAGVCVKMRGRLSELREALDAAEKAGEAAGGKLLTKNLIPAPTLDTERAVAETMYT